MTPTDVAQAKEHLEPVFRSWKLFHPGKDWRCASESQIAQAESVIGRRLPVELRVLYKFAHGFGVVGNNLCINRLTPGTESMSLTENFRKLPKWGWPIPDELLVFGGNGGDELFGIWVPRGSRDDDPHPVISVGAIFEPGSFAVAGTELCRFLLGWTAMYARSYVWDGEADAAALRELGMPLDLSRKRKGDALSQKGIREIFRWADPSLAEPPNPYGQRLTAERLRKQFGSGAKRS